MSNEENKTATEDQQIETGIGYNDLVLARNVIQIASKRGAFTDPNEYREIGELFQKFDRFVKSVEAQVAEQKEDKEASTAETEVTAEIAEK